MADWRAFDRGIRTGQALGTAMRERKGRKLFGDVMTGNAQETYSGAIPMPGETEDQWAARADAAEGPVQPRPGGTQQVSYTGATMKGQMAQLSEALASGGIDEEAFFTGVQHIGMRSYTALKQNWDNFHELDDDASRQQSLQEMINLIPGSGMQYVVATGDGNFATVPHDEDGNPIKDAQGLYLTPELIDSMVTDATKDPEQWFKFVGMSTMDMADYNATLADTAATVGKERRAQELHPLEMESEGALADQRRAYAARGGSSSTAATGWKPKDALKAVDSRFDAEADRITNDYSINDEATRQQQLAENEAQRMRAYDALDQGMDPMDAVRTGMGLPAGQGRSAGSQLGGPAQPPASAPAQPGAAQQLEVGTVRNGYRYEGGPIHDTGSWTKVD